MATGQEEKEILTIFETARNFTNSTDENTYSIAGALLLSGKWMSDWWEISLSIFLWMTLSFMIFLLLLFLENGSFYTILPVIVNAIFIHPSTFFYSSLNAAKPQVQVISIGASLLSLITLRKHPYACFIPIPFIIMMFIIPLVFGAPTSMALAFAMYASKNPVSTWYCAVMGTVQTILIFLMSLTRIHASL